jgi:hypothetical protein
MPAASGLINATPCEWKDALARTWLAAATAVEAGLTTGTAAAVVLAPLERKRRRTTI